MKIGIIRERKIPPDSRVPLTPEQCAFITEHYPIEIKVRPSPIRCFSDDEYREAGVTLSEDLSDCDILMGVKEIPINYLMRNKTYFFFSHTLKEQPHNRDLLRAILERNIRLIDYEAITNESGQRLIAFGRFAGMVGAHNGVMTYGMRTKTFQLPRLKDFLNYAEAKRYYSRRLKLPPMKIVLTGTGRVGRGAAEVLRDMNIREVSASEFLNLEFDEAVFTNLDSQHYLAHKESAIFNKLHFYDHPGEYKSTFAPFLKAADLMINGIYWDNEAPAFFTLEEMRRPDFRIQVIADITCDISPVSSIPSTLRASTIADPVFGFDPQTGKEAPPFQPNVIDMMTIDNLPSELPRDASEAFGQMFIDFVLPELLQPESRLLERATIAENGQLGRDFKYLQDYVDGKR